MTDLTKEEKDHLKDDVMKELFRTTDAQMRKTRVSQCSFDKHVWRQLNENEIACEKCPTVLIIQADHISDFIKEEVKEKEINE